MSFNLQSSKFENNFLRTDGNTTVNCQYNAGPWEKWQFNPEDSGPGYYIQSVHFPGKYLSINQDDVTIADSKSDATVFKLIVCDPLNTKALAIQSPGGKFVSITEQIPAPNGAGGGKVSLIDFKEESIFILSVAQKKDASEPEIQNVKVNTHPAIPEGLKPTFLKGPDTLDSSTTCDVIKMDGKTFWAYSFIDNRVGMGIVGYDSSNNKVKQLEVLGARYLWKITKNTDDKTVTFHGQSSQMITLEWDELIE